MTQDQPTNLAQPDEASAAQDPANGATDETASDADSVVVEATGQTPAQVAQEEPPASGQDGAGAPSGLPADPLPAVEAVGGADDVSSEELQGLAGEDTPSNGTPTPDAQPVARADDATEQQPAAVEPPFQATWVLQRLRDLADRAPLQGDEPGGEGVRRRLTATAAEAVTVCLQQTAGLAQARALADELIEQGWIVPETDSWKSLLDRLSQTDADALLERKRAKLAALAVLVNQREKESKALESAIAAAEVRKATIDAEVEARYQEKRQDAEQRIKAQAEEQKKRLDAQLASKKAAAEKQQGILDDLLARKGAELKDLQEQRVALHQEIADLRAGKLELKPTTALTAIQQREMEQMKTTNQELAAQKATLEQEVLSLRFRAKPGTATTPGAALGKSDGWQRLFEALKLTQTGLLYQVKHAVEEAEAVAAVAGKTGDRLLESDARDLAKTWRAWSGQAEKSWDAARRTVTAGKLEQALQLFDQLYRSGVRGANTKGEIEQAQADALNTAARAVADRASAGYRDLQLQQQDKERMKGYAATAQELMQRSAGQKVQDEVHTLVGWIPDWYRSWAKATQTQQVPGIR